MHKIYIIDIETGETLDTICGLIIPQAGSKLFIQKFENRVDQYIVKDAEHHINKIASEMYTNVRVFNLGVSYD